MSNVIVKSRQDSRSIGLRRDQAQSLWGLSEEEVVPCKVPLRSTSNRLLDFRIFFRHQSPMKIVKGIFEWILPAVGIFFLSDGRHRHHETIRVVVLTIDSALEFRCKGLLWKIVSRYIEDPWAVLYGKFILSKSVKPSSETIVHIFLLESVLKGLIISHEDKGLSR